MWIYFFLPVNFIVSYVDNWLFLLFDVIDLSDLSQIGAFCICLWSAVYLWHFSLSRYIYLFNGGLSFSELVV